MSTKTRALMLLAMLAASLVLAAAQAPGAPPGAHLQRFCFYIILMTADTSFMLPGMAKGAPAFSAL